MLARGEGPEMGWNGMLRHQHEFVVGKPERLLHPVPPQPLELLR